MCREFYDFHQFKYFEATMNSAAETIKVANHPSVDTEYN